MAVPPQRSEVALFRERPRRLLAVALALLAIAAGCSDGPRVPLSAMGHVVPVHFPAPTLGMPAREAIVYLPASYDAPGAAARRYPVVYFLHGGPGWHGDWFQHGDLARTLDRLIAEKRVPEVIAIAPDGHGAGRKGMSLWMDNWNGTSRIETFLTRDVIAWADSAFRTRPDARDRALVGISDGGDAAVRLLLEHPDLYGAGAGLSGRYHPHGSKGLEAVVGPEPYRTRNLIREAALGHLGSAARRMGGRFIYLDAGVLDNTAWDLIAMDMRMGQLDIAHETHLYVGYHDWPFWRRRLAIALPAVTAGFTAAPHGSAQKL